MNKFSSVLGKLKELLFKSKTQGQIIFKNFIWLLTGQVGSRIFRASFIVYAARALGAAEYGVVSYVLGLAGFFTIFTDIGVNQILTKETAMTPERRHNIFATGFWIKMALISLSTLLILFAAPHFSKIEAAVVLLPFVAMLTLFDGLREFAIAFFRAEEKMELEALVTTTTNAAITIFGFMILFFIPTSKAVAITYALSAGTGAILGIYILRNDFKNIFRYFKRELLAPILKLAWPIALISLAGIFMINVDIILIGFFKSAKDVGFYSASQKIIQLLYTLPTILAVSLYPALAKLVGRGDNEEAGRLMGKGMITSFLLAVPVVVGGVILGADVINFLYGGGYLAAVTTFRVMLFTALLIYPGPHLSFYILVYNQQKKAIPIVLIASLTNLLLNILLIPKFGTVGAALGTCGGLLLLNGLSWIICKRANNFIVLPHLKKIVAASAVMGLVSLSLKWFGTYVLINVAISAGAYFIALYALKEPVVAEVKSLFKLKGAN